MTKAEILALPNENLNTLAAGYILHECYHEHQDSAGKDHIECLRCGQDRFYHQLSQDFTGDIVAAWRVEEFVACVGYAIHLYRRETGWYCDFRGPASPEVAWVENQPSAPEAICRAALLAKTLDQAARAVTQ